MQKSQVIGFDVDAMVARIMQPLVTEQSRRLVDYAKQEILKLGDMIQTYHSRYHMDRTGNLLNSLCWGVTYKGQIIDSGFYREAVAHSRGRYGGSTSWLHEFFADDAEERNGRQLASDFIKSYKGSTKGWNVFFAILADYWGYWESGFTMKMGGSTVYQGFKQERTIPFSTRFMKFAVMTHVYDDVRKDLKPTKTRFTVYVPKYIYKSQKWKKKFKNRVGVKKIGVLR